jgi:hypothetical protein
MGIDLKPGGRCIRCKTCDGFPCRELAKAESDVCHPHGLANSSGLVGRHYRVSG